MKSGIHFLRSVKVFYVEFKKTNMKIKTNIHWLAVHAIHGIKIGRQYTSKILGLSYFLEFSDKQSVGQREST